MRLPPVKVPEGVIEKEALDVKEEKSSRYILVSIKAAVWKRDHTQCIYVGPSGHRCESRHALQLEHVLRLQRAGKQDGQS